MLEWLSNLFATVRVDPVWQKSGGEPSEAHAAFLSSLDNETGAGVEMEDANGSE